MKGDKSKKGVTISGVSTCDTMGNCWQYKDDSDPSQVGTESCRQP